MFFLTSTQTLPFDYIYYLENNNINQPDMWFTGALNHFACHGLKQGLQTTETQIDNTNFDWEYYVNHNKLSAINDEQQAYKHYLQYGKKLQLPYCKHFNIIILLHLYDFEIMDEIIGKINYFINNNPLNKYHIKINVPVDARVLNLPNFCGGYNDIETDEASFFLNNKITSLDKQISTLVQKSDYAPILYHIYHYLQKTFVLNKSEIQVVFSENRGMDIGGFFVLLNEIKKENKPFDFLIKLHTKRGSVLKNQFFQTWRACIMSFLNIKINKVLRTYNSVYSCKMNCLNWPPQSLSSFLQKTNELCNILNLPQNNTYNFSAGTMFITSYDVYVNHLQKWNLENLYSLLKKGKVDSETEVGYEHAFEGLFGYIKELTSSKILCLDYMPHGCAIKHNVP
jgi:hypothetical protein